MNEHQLVQSKAPNYKCPWNPMLLRLRYMKLETSIRGFKAFIELLFSYNAVSPSMCIVTGHRSATARCHQYLLSPHWGYIFHLIDFTAFIATWFCTACFQCLHVKSLIAYAMLRGATSMCSLTRGTTYYPERRHVPVEQPAARSTFSSPAHAS